MATTVILGTCYNLFLLRSFHKNQDLCLVFEVSDKNFVANTNFLLVRTDLFPSPTVVTRGLATLKQGKKSKLYLSNH